MNRDGCRWPECEARVRDLRAEVAALREECEYWREKLPRAERDLAEARALVEGLARGLRRYRDTGSNEIWYPEWVDDEDNLAKATAFLRPRAEGRGACGEHPGCEGDHAAHQLDGRCAFCGQPCYDGKGCRNEDCGGGP